MESNNIIIRKAKLAKGGTVEVSYIDIDGNEVSLKGKNKCHSDLRNAFAGLVPFFADLTEQKEADSIDWDDLASESNTEFLRRLDVTGFSIGGDENNRVVTMSGKRTLITSRVLNLNAPGVEMGSETFEWPHINEFDVVLEQAVFEVKEYLINRKWEVVQGELDFDANPEDPFAEAQPTQEVQPIAQPEEVVA